MSDARHSSPAPAAVGVDVGGSSAKGALVDLARGVLLGERWVVPVTPGMSLAALADGIHAFLADDARHAVGATYPGVVEGGVTYTAANVPASWNHQPLAALLSKRLGRTVPLLNDADAAGIAEMTLGAARGARGTVLVLTLGTGIGSALFIDGRLVPNTELGHLEVGGREAEARAAGRVLTATGMRLTDWAAELDRVLGTYHALLRPGLFVLCGGVTERAGEFLSLLKSPVPVRIGAFGADAGIVGAALVAAGAVAA